MKKRRKEVIILTEAEWKSKFSDKVLSKMDRVGVNQRELSKVTRIPENTLGRYINGERVPRVDAVVNIARALECSVSELVQFGDIVTK